MKLSLLQIVVLLFLFTTIGLGQEVDKVDLDLCKRRAKTIANKLEKTNSIRMSVEKGGVGRCIRHPWMDSMQKFGIKRVMSLVVYSWNKKKEKIKINGITYQTEYENGNIEDKKLLRRIKESGLEQELKNVIRKQVEESEFTKKYMKSKSGKEEFQVDLLDDESLPAQWWIF